MKRSSETPTVFRRFAHSVSHAVGMPSAFVLACLVIVVWGATGPFFNYSDTWQLAINTGTTIVTFLMCFVIQNTQNRDSQVVQLKLDEDIQFGIWHPDRPRGDQFHAGLDFPAPTGTAITAAASGRAIFAGYDDGWGLTVVLDHGNGVHTRYAHLSVAQINVGTAVNAGTQIGRVGSTGHATGPHLHFEVTVRGANADPGVALGLY